MGKLKVNWSVECAWVGPQAPFGAGLVRLTSAPLISDNIYGEQPRCTPDGMRIAFHRRLPGQSPQVWIADFEQRRIGLVEGFGKGVATAKYTGLIYHIVDDGGTRRLHRFNLATLADDTLCDVGPLAIPGSPCVSLDGRWYYGLRNQGPHRFDIVRLDVESGEWTSIYADPDICNPHLQTCPASGDLLVQHNRGCRFDADGRITHLVGPEGATLFVIDPDGGNYRQIPVGPPFSQWSTTGHECWVGRTGWVVYTDVRPNATAVQTGNVLAARPGDANAIPVTSGYFLSHISVSACGRFFVGDAVHLDRTPLVVGAMATGRTVILCFSDTTDGTPQWIHTHPYFTPDNRFVIFNSDRSGVPQIYRVEIPDGLLDGLDAPAGIGLHEPRNT